MSQITLEDDLALKKFGLRVPQNQRQQLLKQIRSNQALKDQFEKIKQSLKTMTDEDQFLDTIRSSHQKIAQIPQNHKVIQVRDNTFVIRAINPQQIQSLTQRAFFNSFSLERIMMKDIEFEQQNKKQSQQVQQKKEQKQPTPKEQNYDTQKANCICGKIKQKETEWIQCANEGKCRGSSCGLVNPNLQDLENLQYICAACKRAAGQQQSGTLEPTKKVKKN